MRLPLTMQTQLQSDWCWAAVTASVSQFYRPNSGWTQCSVADAALVRQDCCGAGGSDPNKCNKPFYLEVALDVTSHLLRIEPRHLSVTEVQNELSNGRPLCCRIEWVDRTGHFLSIIDCFVGQSGDTYLSIADPIFLETQILFQDFASAYQTGASWTHSYFTTGSAAGGAAMAMAQPKQPHHPDAIGA
ncbi:papain-like cysteine protease family protein [Lichenibacterium dinghuense]|uniref:papain-like cysteine protease family protein n=1 Tax=Lichenibacterium dinghuense TaxID=2895977 RepID=UPI001F280738|nr:papain-like cysteine protease family protein [Lichenibacterium sp. 6Y81]